MLDTGGTQVELAATQGETQKAGALLTCQSQAVTWRRPAGSMCCECKRHLSTPTNDGNVWQHCQHICLCPSLKEGQRMHDDAPNDGIVN